MNKLIALLPHTAPQGEDRLHGWQVEPDGRVHSVVHTVQELARSKAAHHMVVVPAACLSWHTVVLPATVKLQGDARLLPVLQSLLEEVLLDEPELVHIALMPGAAAGQSCVLAVCDRAWLSTWLETLERAGIKIDRLLPEIAPDVLGQEGMCSGINHSGWVTALQGGVLMTVPLQMDAASVQHAPVFHALPATFSEAEHVFGADKVQLASDQEWVQRMLQTQWELMQHGFASTPLERMRRKCLAGLRDVLSAPQWRASRLAVVALAIVGVVGLHVQAWTQQRALTAKREAVVKTVQQTFPQVRVVIDAPLQMQRELQTLRQVAGVLSATDLEPMAAAAGAALSSAGLTANAIEYNGAQLLLRGVGSQQLAAVNEQLQGSRYVAEVMGDALQLKVRP